MATITLFFILAFIAVQCIVGLLLLYRGFALTLAHYQDIDFKNMAVVAGQSIKSALSFVTWKRAAVVAALLTPGTIPVLLFVVVWRNKGRFEPALLWRVSTRRLRTAIQNIAL